LPRDSRGFNQQPYRRISLGFDGDDFPVMTLNVLAIADIDDIYFSLYDLSYWLGFTFDERNISTAPANVPTPNRHITRETFPIGSRQVVDYAHTLIVRTEPNNSSQILTYVHRGDKFEILDYNGRFVQIYTDKGAGWIFAGFLSRASENPRPAARNDSELIAVLELIRSHNWRDMWVDKAYHYSPVIDETAVFPVGFGVFPTIFEMNTRIIGGIHRGFPIAPLIENIGGFGVLFRPVKIHESESGIVELRYDFSRYATGADHGDIWTQGWTKNEKNSFENRRIIIDTRNLPVQTIRYYIGETGYDLVRLDEGRDPSRYTAESVDGGIRLAWHVPAWSVWVESSPIRLYRSAVRGERGILLSEIFTLRSYRWSANEWQYDFIDTTISDDGTYYYSLWVSEFQGEEEPILIGGERQMAVRRN
jgi:hypothetical protein